MVLGQRRGRFSFHLYPVLLELVERGHDFVYRTLYGHWHHWMCRYARQIAAPLLDGRVLKTLPIGSPILQLFESPFVFFTRCRDLFQGRRQTVLVFRLTYVWHIFAFLRGTPKNPNDMPTSKDVLIASNGAFDCSFCDIPSNPIHCGIVICHLGHTLSCPVYAVRTVRHPSVLHWKATLSGTDHPHPANLYPGGGGVSGVNGFPWRVHPILRFTHQFRHRHNAALCNARYNSDDLAMAIMYELYCRLVAQTTSFNAPDDVYDLLAIYSGSLTPFPHRTDLIVTAIRRLCDELEGKDLQPIPTMDRKVIEMKREFQQGLKDAADRIVQTDDAVQNA